jgi:hypothetical protein
MAAFSWGVQGNVPTTVGAAAAIEGSTDGSSNVSGAGMAADADEGTGSVSSAGASGSTSGLPLVHTLDAFAAVTVQVVRTPAMANTKGIGSVFDPEAAAGSGAPAERMGAPASVIQAPAAAGSAGAVSSSSAGQSQVIAQAQFALCAVLAALALQQYSGQLLVLLLQLLLLAAIGAAAVIPKSSSTSSSRELPVRSSAGQQQSAPGVQQSSDSSSENVRCCGWSIMLVTADLCSAPSRHLQLQASVSMGLQASCCHARCCQHTCRRGVHAVPCQWLSMPVSCAVQLCQVACHASCRSLINPGNSWDVAATTRSQHFSRTTTPRTVLCACYPALPQVSLAKASRGMARLRLRMASMSTGGVPLSLLGAPSDDDESLPVLVSDPEPVWLNTDTRQR